MTQLMKHKNFTTQKNSDNILTSGSVIALDSVLLTYSLEMLTSTESTAAGLAPMIAPTRPIPSRGES